MISLGTVKEHLSNIFVKLGVTRRNELIHEVSRNTQQPVGLKLPEVSRAGRRP